MKKYILLISSIIIFNNCTNSIYTKNYKNLKPYNFVLTPKVIKQNDFSTNLITELENNNHLILNKHLTLAACQDQTCSNRDEVALKHKFTNFIDVDIKENKNSVDYKFSLTDTSYNKIINKKASYSFNQQNDYQIQKINFHNKFIDKINLAIPKVIENYSIGDTQNFKVKIKNTQITKLSEDTYKVCLETEPRLKLSTLINKKEFQIKEIENGRYCDTLLINNFKNYLNVKFKKQNKHTYKKLLF